MKNGRCFVGDELKSVYARHYDPAVHGDEILCGDPQCSAKMTVVSKHFANGGTCIPQHFRTLKSAIHIDGCLGVMRDNATKKSMTLLDALYHKNANIMFNINFPTGQTSFGQCGNLDVEHAPTRYNLWFDKQARYGAVAMPNLTKLFNTINKMKSVKPESLNKVTVGHCQDIASLGDVLINNDNNRLTALFKQIYGARKSGDDTQFFPRVFEFTPLKTRNKSSPILAGQGVVATHGGAQNFFIQNILDFGGHNHLCRTFIENGAGHIMAVPDINFAEAQKTAAAYKNGQKPHEPAFRLYWKIITPDQFSSQTPPSDVAVQTKMFDVA